MSRTLLVATSNPGKLREFERALARAGWSAVGLDALPAAAAELPEPEETGETFAANARLKAEAYSRRTDLPTLADDSGLEVDALGGAPGVRSARWGGPGLDDAGRNRALLDALRDVADPAARTARFRCALALARAGRTLGVFEGAVEGRIAFEERGTRGFGYDPLFHHPPFAATFGEVDPDRKRAVSHRGRALDALLAALDALLGRGDSAAG